MATLVPGEKARMFALGGIMRGGASRGGYVDNRVYITVGGGYAVGWVRGAPGTLIDSLTIQQQLDEAPDTCSLRVNGAVLPLGETIVSLGSQHGKRLFAGYSLTRTQLYAADKPANIQADYAAVDYTWLLGFQKVTKKYEGASGTAIIADLIQTYGGDNGFTTGGVQQGLPALDITFTDEDVPNAITRLMRRLGGHWYCDYYKDIHAWTGDTDPTGGTPPTDLTPTHPTFADFRAIVDQTQSLTRVYVEHQGSRLLSAVTADETKLPLETVGGMVAAPDTFLKLSFQGAEGGARHLDFDGVVEGGRGTLVGPGQAPGTGPTVQGASGGAIDIGFHDYAFTWITATGETKPSPAARLTVVASLSTPTIAPNLLNNTAQNAQTGSPPAWLPGDTVDWGYVYAYAVPYGSIGAAGNNATPISPLGSIVAEVSPQGGLGRAKAIEVQVPYSNDPACHAIYAVHRVNGGPWWLWHRYEGSWDNRTDNPGGVAVPYAPSRVFYAPHSDSINYTPEAANPVSRSARVDGIATGPGGVTTRKLYRSKANTTALWFLASLADNTTTSYSEGVADSTLGAAAPVGDTSGLQVPAGSVNAGATEIIVASTGPFEADGGWAVIAGQQYVRYTGLAAGKLTGLPIGDIGSLTGPIAYNTPIAACPMVTGVPATGPRSIDQPLHEGHEVYAVVQVDDLGAQTALADRLGVATGTREEWVQDRRLSYAEAKARGQATIAARPLDAYTVHYTCRDLNTAIGQMITVNLPAPTGFAGTFRIQAVTLSNFRPRPEQRPTFHVTASSTRFTFEDWLRIIKTRE